MKSYAKALLMTMGCAAALAMLAAFHGGKGFDTSAVARALRGVLPNQTAPAAAASAPAASAGTEGSKDKMQPAAPGNRTNGTTVGRNGSGRAASNSTQPELAGKADGTVSMLGNCLCLFDIDRTLTGRQGDTCGGSNSVVGGVWDPAYGGGTLTLSALGRAGVSSTFCGACKLGVISAGNGGGSGMRGRICGGVLGGRAGCGWSGPNAATPLIVGCHDGRKAACADGIRAWYKRQGTYIPRSNVFHFDDKASSVSSFHGSGMNAIQISCNSRDGHTGGCGATPGEVQRKRGVHHC